MRLFIYLSLLGFFFTGCLLEEPNNLVAETVDFKESLEFQTMIELACKKKMTMLAFVEEQRNNSSPQFTKEEIATYKSELIALKKARTENYGTTEEGIKANIALDEKILSPRSLECRAYFRNKMGRTQEFTIASQKARADFFRKFPSVEESDFTLAYSSGLNNCY